MRTLIVLAALGLAAPLAAQTLVPADATGALSGRSPHKVMRVAAQAPACGRTMHTIPAGKLPHYGLNAMPRPCNANVSVALGENDRKAGTVAE